jgi:16S rRNA (guanine1207-N2)-methyltransferase
LETGAGVFSRGGLDEGSALLLETARFDSHARVLDLGCAWGAVGCATAKTAPDARVWMCDINWHATQLARRNRDSNALQNATVWCGDGTQSVRSEFFDCVLCNPPVRAGNAVIARLFDDAQRVLKTEGALWVVLRTAQGAKSWARRLEAQFGNCETVAMKSGYRILKCVK